MWPPLTQYGYSQSFIGTATLDGESYRFAAVGLFGTVDERPRYTTQYIFAAPEAIIVQMGGFIPVSAAFFRLDSTMITDLILPAGHTEPAIQATYPANNTDIYLVQVAQAISAFKANLVPSTNMLLEQQCTGASGTGPNAYGITGLGSPDCQVKRGTHAWVPRQRFYTVSSLFQ